MPWVSSTTAATSSSDALPRAACGLTIALPAIKTAGVILAVSYALVALIPVARPGRSLRPGLRNAAMERADR